MGFYLIFVCEESGDKTIEIRAMKMSSKVLFVCQNRDKTIEKRTMKKRIQITIEGD